MALEIERKFLVNGDFKASAHTQFRIRQGYLALSGINVVRVRTKGDHAYITVKSAVKENRITRHEWEYEIPIEDAEEMLEMCEDAIIDKMRYLVDVGEHTFEVDVFAGENNGLVLAEIELISEDEEFSRPIWLGKEVTGNVRYYNSYLSIHPYSEWNNE